jgi:hypothetical protein
VRLPILKYWLVSSPLKPIISTKVLFPFQRTISFLCTLWKRRTHNGLQHGFAARLAGRWSNGHFIAVVLHLGWTFNLGLLFVNLYFYIFNQQRFRADTATIPALQASPARCLQ